MLPTHLFISKVIIRVLQFKQNIKEAVDFPRIHHQVFPMEVEYEYGTLQVRICICVFLKKVFVLNGALANCVTGRSSWVGGIRAQNCSIHRRIDNMRPCKARGIYLC